MGDDVSDIARFYDSAGFEEDSRLDQHQLERDATLRYFEEYLPPSSNILEIGAATGWYTVWLARHGHRVTAVDLSGNLTEECKKRVSKQGLEASVDCFVADAHDLSSLPQGMYDAVLLMGPLYHLILREDRVRALRESYDRLKPGGIFFSALISRYGLIADLLRHKPEWVENHKEVRSVIEQGHNTENLREGGWRGYYAMIEVLGPFTRKSGCRPWYWPASWSR